MKRYPLADLLRVRKLRKDRAEEDVQRAKQKLLEAEQWVKTCKKELEDFKIFRLKEIDRLYSSVMKKDIKREKVDEIAFDIATLDGKVIEYERAIEAAKQAVEVARQEVEDRRAALHKAMQSLQKIDEHKTAWVAGTSKEELALLEKELEDFRPKERS
ncbi:MAG: hypothetical protein A2Y14_03325 [Verrucomicrobia bacterium GWF2_51_19]|nr:MAG: hypothetical protein A2Y14_03325 [Verrucomicrobia bacterium GWF2_51_19]HCJ11747.1 hypothetical protein [Opitutae bacterium]